ncbi:DNA polymerase delta, subunit 4-domain-containing protein [Lentinula lateritia]|uniref:DNA polymerase delta, subunit 4-domain-containing protein n=1 Tax=Lentinula aff. lateritia TaxID=2804960 RepID=A0ACC1TT80_9AGAR|nr:DNA polymerase delta, subunit 4-domain-containing protein [Lentinula aff. lateritia]KAJ3846699.1 DNA polymerase delta, subunit 4-domain-containing protein [Lentinula lateritia]
MPVTRRTSSTQSKLNFGASKSSPVVVAGRKGKHYDRKALKLRKVEPQFEDVEGYPNSSSSDHDDTKDTNESEVVERSIAVTTLKRKRSGFGDGKEKKKAGVKNEEQQGQAGPQTLVKSTKPRPELIVNDPRWRKLSAQARAVNGNLQLVHAENQNKIHDILRVFDLSYEYGPCYGISRLDRWERAEAMGLNPPPEIHAILSTRQGVEETQYAQCVFFDQAERI